jgi:diacylglycerol kinase (ATP)
MKSDKFSLKSRIGSFRFALNGMRSLLKYEHNSRIHVISAIIALVLGIVFKLKISEWCLLLVVTGLVLITELLNSSLESLADRIDPEWDEQIMRAKDYAAAAVLLSALIALITGCLIFIPKLLALF